MTEEIPSKFSGLLHRPSNENEVYLLMGLLWNHLPYRFAFEEFEVNPRKRGYNHTKWLDARGKMWEDGEWVNVNFEFKLYSRSLLRDIEKHPNFGADFLICWAHNSPEIERYVGEVISLKEIYEGLSEEKRRSIILRPRQSGKPVSEEVPVEEHLEEFSDTNRPKIKHLLKLCPRARGGVSEIIFLRESETLLRAVNGASEHITIPNPPSEDIKQTLIDRFGGISQQATVRIPLGPLDSEDLEELVKIIRE